MKSLIKNPFVILLFLVLVAGLAYLLISKPSTKPSTGAFSWKVSQVKENNTPPNYELDVYLTGEKVDQTSAIELDANLDNALLQLSSAEAGGFFTNPLIIKMDTTNMVFAIAKNPATQTQTDPNQPVFKLHFTGTSGFTQSTFNILPSSQIYIKDTGGANPATTQFVVQK